MRKRVLAAAVLLLCAALLLMPAAGVSAASKNYMKKLKGVKWGLKVGKTYKINTKYAGIGNRKTTFKIKKCKVQKYTDGYSAAEIVFTMKRFKPTKAEVSKMGNSAYCAKTGAVGGSCGYTVLDYDTGKCLEVDNSKNVSVTYEELETKWNKYTASDGSWVSLKNITYKVTITYPTSFKGVCFGIDGSSSVGETKNNEAFWKGKTVFGKTTYYKGSRFMRIK